MVMENWMKKFRGALGESDYGSLPDALTSRDSRKFVVEFDFETDTIDVKPRADENPKLMLDIDTLIALRPSTFTDGKTTGGVYTAPDLIFPVGDWKITPDSFDHIFGQFATRVDFMKYYLIIVSMVFPNMEGDEFGKVEAFTLENLSIAHKYRETRKVDRFFTMDRVIQQLIVPEYMFPCNVNVETTHKRLNSPKYASTRVTRQYGFSLKTAHWVDLRNINFD